MSVMLRQGDRVA